MSSRARIVPGDGDPRHGTLNGYANLKCRCAGCRQANADEVYAAREWRANHPIPPSVAHGTVSTYTNYRCRCSPCIAAQRAYNATRYQSAPTNQPGG